MQYSFDTMHDNFGISLVSFESRSKAQVSCKHLQELGNWFEHFSSMIQQLQDTSDAIEHILHPWIAFNLFDISWVSLKLLVKTITMKTFIWDWDVTTTTRKHRKVFMNFAYDNRRRIFANSNRKKIIKPEQRDEKNYST